MGGALAEARRAKAKSDTHHGLDDRDGFREELNPSYDRLPIFQDNEFVNLPETILGDQ
jgi:hypothetical protein